MGESISISEAEQILGLTGTYVHKDLQSAYRQKIKHAHPDVGGSAEEAARINNAKDCLEELFKYDANRVVACSKSSSSSSSASGDEANRASEGSFNTSSTRESSASDARGGASSQARTSRQGEQVSATPSSHQWTVGQQAGGGSWRRNASSTEQGSSAYATPPRPPLRIRTWFVCLKCWVISAYLVAPVLLGLSFLALGVDFYLDGTMDTSKVDMLSILGVIVAAGCNIAPILIGRRIARSKQRKYWDQQSNT